MRRTTLALAAAIALVAATAEAHGPTRRKIQDAITIDAPADKVWAVVGKLDDAGWMQNVTKTEVSGDPPAKYKRVLTLTSGGTIQETSNKYKPEDRMVSYYIDKVNVKDLPANDYSASISVEPDGADKSKVEWKAAFYRGYMNNDPPPELNDAASEKAVAAWIKASLANLKARVEKGS